MNRKIKTRKRTKIWIQMKRKIKTKMKNLRRNMKMMVGDVHNIIMISLKSKKLSRLRMKISLKNNKLSRLRMIKRKENHQKTIKKRKKKEKRKKMKNKRKKKKKVLK